MDLTPDQLYQIARITAAAVIVVLVVIAALAMTEINPRGEE